MRRGRRRLFSSKSVSFSALLGLSLGAISVLFLALCLRRACLRGGEPGPGSGAVLAVCLFYSLAGLVSSILSRQDPEGIYSITYLGMALNGAALVFASVCMFIGL